MDTLQERCLLARFHIIQETSLNQRTQTVTYRAKTSIALFAGGSVEANIKTLHDGAKMFYLTANLWTSHTWYTIALLQLTPYCLCTVSQENYYQQAHGKAY